MRRQDYLRYRQFKKASRGKKCVRRPRQRHRVHHLCKIRLLSIIHLALLMMGSEIQLGDLLRFIREGHLSFAKVTHFFPKEIKFSKGDVFFVESVCDDNMPTHLSQRKHGQKLARLVSLSHLLVPDMASLVARYCCELNLPDTIAVYSTGVAQLILPHDVVSITRGRYLPNFEAVAAACILFTMKLLLGLNGVTELLLSDLAEKINRMNALGKIDKKHFSFTAWQRYIECRKCIMSDMHYPTEERLRSNAMGSSKFIDMVTRESKDEFRGERFVPYKPYYISEDLLSSVRNALNHLSQSASYTTIDFPPSLTPQSSYISLILELYKERQDETGERESGGVEFPDIGPAAMEILNMDFRQCDVDFVLTPEKYEARLATSGFKIVRLGKSDLARVSGKGFIIETEDSTRLDMSTLSSSSVVVFVDDPAARYWIRKPLWVVTENTAAFEEDVLNKTTLDFVWILRELSGMLEMNPREVYRELMVVEAGVKRRGRLVAD